MTLLKKAHIRAKPEVMTRLQKLNSGAILTAGTCTEAIYWYEWARDLPKTVTRGVFRNKTGYILDGAHPTVDGLILAFTEDSKEYMCKIMKGPEDPEVFFATAVSGGPFIVPSSFETADYEADGNKHIFCGLLMPRYSSSMLGLDVQFSEKWLLHVARQLVEAVNFAHSRNIVHSDIKEANLFKKDDVLYLGDWGSAVYHGELVKEATMGYFRAMEDIRGKPAQWQYDWFALAMSLASIKNIHHNIEFERLADSVPELIATCNNGDLKELLQAMSVCNDQYM